MYSEHYKTVLCYESLMDVFLLMLTMLTVIFIGADCNVFLFILTMLTVIFTGADRDKRGIKEKGANPEAA